MASGSSDVVLLSSYGMPIDFANSLGNSIQDYSYLEMAWTIRYSPLTNTMGLFLWAKETLLGDSAFKGW
jgi:hypothetical protein